MDYNLLINGIYGSYTVDGKNPAPLTMPEKVLILL